MIIGKRDFDLKNKTYIMGILNVTPDSFSDGGSHDTVDEALKHALKMIEEGADIIDIGGESTRPGADFVSEEEEIGRVIPVLKAIKAHSDIPVSVDTYKAGTAQAALDEGADLINDIWGLRYDKGEMASVVAKSHKPYILMHNVRIEETPEQINNRKLNIKGTSDTIKKITAEEAGNRGTRDFINDIRLSFMESLKIAQTAGIDKDKIILDPGVGFNKSYEENLEILRRLNELNDMGYPILLGCSRKSVIGNALNLPVDERLEGTLVTTILAAQAGCSFVRVHDVVANKRAINMLEAIKFSKY